MILIKLVEITKIHDIQNLNKTRKKMVQTIKSKMVIIVNAANRKEMMEIGVNKCDLSRHDDVDCLAKVCNVTPFKSPR